MNRRMVSMNDSKSESKKLIPIYLQELFLERTDDRHFLRMPEILSYLETKNIYADRRTIYAAIFLLRSAGFDIEGIKEKGGFKYHLINRQFDTNELKFLIDSVAVSKFLTEKKSKELINKIKSFGSIYDSKILNRNILIGERIKSMRDNVLTNIDNIHLATSSNRQITFKYLRWTTKRTLEPSDSKKVYRVSPYAVCLSDNNYYMIAFDNLTKKLRHYRVDKMKSIHLLDEPREGLETYKNFDIADYSKKTFGMFGGREQTISVQCKNSFVGVFIDRFGDSVSIRPNYENPDYCICRMTVNVSPQFYGWIFALGAEVTIVSPQSAIDEFREMAKTIFENYNRN